MSFKNLKQPELKKAAEDFGVELPGGIISNAKIIELLEADGVTYEQWAKLQPKKEEDEAVEVETEEEAEEPVGEERNTLIKMTRANPTFEDRGYRFTRENPYALVTEDDAEWFIETYEGFKIASPKELREFYS